SALLAPASICAENIVKPLMKGAMSDQQLLLVTRVSVLVFSIVASVMACIRSNIYELVSESSILSLVSLFIPLTMGLHWRRANARGAILSMVTGMCAWFIFEQFESDIPSLVPATMLSLFAMVAGSLWPVRSNPQ